MPVITDSFGLPSPPGFRGLDPDLPITSYHRKLPHWRQPGATYFVTSRLADALPQEKLRQLKDHRRRWEFEHPEPRSEADWNEYAREITQKTERWLDEGFGRCQFREPSNADRLMKALRFYQDTKCRVSCLTVMPNHFHAVMKPFGDQKLESTLQAIKGFVANQVGAGRIWEAESHDRIIRDDEHLYRVVQYIGRNGRKAKLGDQQFIRWMHPEWIDAGWRFEPDAPRR